MNEPIENLYFNWLCAKVLPVDNPPYLYNDLFKILYRTPFEWYVLGDRNRIEDGLELREDFVRETRMDSSAWRTMPCSVFEMLLAFAKRACFQTDDPTEEWFWHFLKNLTLDEFRSVDSSDVEHIEKILERFIFRAYDSDGYGGLFPMREPTEDQRKVELWYQLCGYLDEQGMI